MTSPESEAAGCKTVTLTSTELRVTPITLIPPTATAAAPTAEDGDADGDADGDG